MDLEEYLGWIGNIAYIWGAVSLARLRPIESMVLNLIGGVLYIGVGFLSNLYSLIALSALLSLINIIGIKVGVSRRRRKGLNAQN